MMKMLCPSIYQKLHPEVDEDVVGRVCMMCVETHHVMKRPCCNALYCDHCYTKNQKCPNCQEPTKQEARTGATFTVKTYSEHEECRVCLDPGLKRKCCNYYYCDECFYKVPNCRSCGTKVGQAKDKDKGGPIDRAFVYSLLLGWMVTIFVVAIVGGFTFVTSVSETSTPVGLSDYKCYGYFRQCGFRVCVEMPEEVARGEAALPPISQWKKCTLDSAVKLQSQACIYDHQLYDNTDRTMGYDVCEESFTEGVFVFEDTFEHWVNNTEPASSKMKSALWSNIENGMVSDFCGAGEIFGKEKALTFAGPYHRSAQTEDLDVTSGGWLEFEFFFPPIGFDGSNPQCKTGYIGRVYVQYSTDQGATWTNIAILNPSTLRQEKFFYNQLDVPEAAQTNQTRFQFIQPVFEAARDAWALDNVKVHRMLPADWDSTIEYKDNVETGQSEIQQAQCCSDTDWCETRLNDYDIDGECDEFGWYGSPQYLMRMSEMLLLLISFVNIVKFLYIAGQDWYLHKRIPFEAEILELASLEVLNRYFEVRWKPKNLAKYLVADEIFNNVHNSARLEQSLRNEYGDDEGDGEMEVDNKEERRAQRREEKKMKKAMKKLESRKKARNFDASKSSLPLDEIEAHLKRQSEQQIEEQKVESLPEDDPPAVTTVELASEVDLEKRNNVALLRIPFEIDVDEDLTWYFALYTCGCLFVLLLVEASLSKAYRINEQILLFGSQPSVVSIPSGLLITLAFYCDAKEAYFALRHLVPARAAWVPRLTIDMADDVRSLFVGNKGVKIDEVLEFHTMTESYMRVVLGCYVFAVFPWCLFCMILREALFNYASMRIAVPILSSIALSRAVLGPEFVIKIGYSLIFLFDCNFKTREAIGVSFQTQKTKYSAMVTSATVFLVVLFFGVFLFLNWLFFLMPLAIVGGALYGACTGCIHGLPIKPWMVVTQLKEGVRMRVRKSQRCPCVYWGSFCSDIHKADEILILHTTDEIKFNTVLKGGIVGEGAF